MKKFLVSILALMLAVPSFAQFSSGGFELDKEKLYYGARMGLNLGKLSGDLDLSGLKPGLNLGAVIGLRLSSQAPVFLESGLYYTQRGGKDGDAKITLNYLEIPILVKYGIQASDDIALLPFLGPYFSYGVGGRFKDSVAGVDVDESAYDYVNRGDMGVKLGCGIEYNMLYLEVGGQIGITDISDISGSVHGNAIFINFGVNF